MRLTHLRPLALGATALAALATAGADAKIRNRDTGSFVQAIPGSAWHVLGFAQRGLKVGDAWRYVWSARKRYSLLKRAISGQERAQAKWGGPIVIDYRVNKVTTQTIAGRKRRIAMITAVYAGGHTGSLHTGNELYVDQYFNPVQRCVYTKYVLHGRCRDRDTHSVIRSMGAKPIFIGDLEKIRATPAARFSAAPVPPLAKYARSMVKGSSFLYVPVQGGKKKYADTYWSPGLLVPSFVTSENWQGILIGHRKVR